MTRYRASASASPLDRQVQRLVASAARQVQEALDVCARAAREETSSSRRLAVVRHDLGRVLGTLGSVRRAGEGSTAEADVIAAVRAAITSCDEAGLSRVPGVRRDLERVAAALRDVRGTGPSEEPRRRAAREEPAPEPVLNPEPAESTIEGDL